MNTIKNLIARVVLWAARDEIKRLADESVRKGMPDRIEVISSVSDDVWRRDRNPGSSVPEGSAGTERSADPLIYGKALLTRSCTGSPRDTSRTSILAEGSPLLFDPRPEA